MAKKPPKKRKKFPKTDKAALYRNKPDFGNEAGVLVTGSLKDLESVQLPLKAKEFPYELESSALKASFLKTPSVAGESTEQRNRRVKKGQSKPSIESLSTAMLEATEVSQDTAESVKIDAEGPKYKEPKPVKQEIGDLPAADERTKPEDSSDARGDEYDTRTKKEVQLSMRYRIPKKLQKLEEKKLRGMAMWVDEQMRLADDQRTAFLERLTQYRASWNDFVKTGIAPGFKGGHDVHIPMTFEKIRTMHARIYQAVMGIDPIFSIKPRKPIAEEMKVFKEDILQWAVKDYANREEGWTKAIDQDILNFVADGTSITKHYWTRDVRKFIDVESREKRPLELDQNGHLVMEEREVEREEVVYDGPMMMPVRLEDVFIVGNNADDINDADMVVHRQQYTRSDVIKMAQLGFFDSDAAERVCKRDPQNATANNLYGNDNLLRYLDDYVTGVDKTSWGGSVGHNTYVIHESYFRYDIDDDGIDEELVAWIEEESKEVLRITYLERVGPGGKRPFVLKKFIPRQGSYYGLGMAEMLFGLNNEMDMLHNMRLDYGTLQNLPFGFYRAASGLNPQDINLGPGKLIPVDDPQGDVSFPRMGGGTGYGFSEEQQVVSYAEKASGVNEIAMGGTGGQGAARTATGASILANAANAGIDIFIRRYQEGFKDNLHILDLQLQDLLPLGMVARVVGIDGKDIYRQFTDRNSIKFEVDYCLEGNSSNSNKLVERDVALQMMQLLSNPLYIQTGMVQPKNLYNVIRNVLQKFEYKNIDAYLTKPEGADDNPYSAKDELSAILAGVRLPKTMRDRHEEKLMFFEEFENSDDFGILEPEHLPLYKEYKDWHQQMAASMAAQANNPAIQNDMMAPALAAEIAAGNPGGTASGAPAQQLADLVPSSSVLGQ